MRRMHRSAEDACGASFPSLAKVGPPPSEGWVEGGIGVGGDVRAAGEALGVAS